MNVVPTVQLDVDTGPILSTGTAPSGSAITLQREQGNVIRMIPHPHLKQVFAVLTDDFRVLVLDVFSPSDPLCSFSVDPSPEKSSSATSGSTGSGGGWLAKTMSQAVGLIKSSVGWLPMGGLAFLGQGGEHVAVGTSDGRLVVASVSTGKVAEEAKVWKSNAIVSIGVAEFLPVAEGAPLIDSILWITEDGTVGQGKKVILQGTGEQVCAVLVEKKRLWVGVKSGLMVMDAPSAAVARRETCPAVSALCHLRDGQVLSGHEDGSIRVWSATTQGPEASRMVKPRVKICSALSPSRVAAQALDGAGGAGPGAASGSATTGSGSELEDIWLGCGDGSIVVLRGSHVGEPREWKAHAGAVGVLAVSAVTSSAELAKDRPLASLGASGEVRLWDPLRKVDWVNEQLGEAMASFVSLETCRLKFVTWNLYGKGCEGVDLRPLLSDPEGAQAAPDFLFVGLQEIVPLNATSVLMSSARPLQSWEEAIEKTLALVYPTGPQFSFVISRQLVGIALIMFARESAFEMLTCVEASITKTGFRGMVGNKGGVSVSFRYHDSLLSATVCHLATGDSAVEQRNSDMRTILAGAEFPARPAHPWPSCPRGTSIEDHDSSFVFGDLNYRISLSREAVTSLCTGQDWPTLIVNDQLSKERKKPGSVWSAFGEAPISFRPTYKVDPGTDQWDTSEKNRTPAYCDRVLYLTGNGRAKVTSLRYDRVTEMTLSDHKPVVATYEVGVKVTDMKGLSEKVAELDQEWADRHSA